MHQQIHAVRHARVNTGETNELLRVTCHQSRGDFVVTIDANRVGIAQRKHYCTVDLAHGVFNDIRVAGQLDGIGTSKACHLQMEGENVRIFVHIHMAINDHGAYSFLQDAVTGENIG